MHKECKPIKFPEDEQAHNHIIEWWYFNGHLKDKRGNEYAFMDCLFRADTKKVKIPFFKKMPFKTIYFYHSLLSDIKRKKFYPLINYLSMVSRDSFSKPLLFINHTNPVMIKGYSNFIIEETEKFKYHLKNENVDLKLISIKKPLLEGGKGYVKLNSKSTYYYSLTNLKTEGTIRINNKIINVKGKSWMDHQWADESYSKDKWTWFSIQLDNNTEMVCFEYDNGKVKDNLASISYPNNKQEHTDQVNLIPMGIKWTSPKTKATYPLSWRIIVPNKNIELKVTALIKEQDMLFGSINYWEGPLKVTGIFNGKKAKGVGFMELVGYPSKYNNMEYTKDGLRKLMNQIFSYAKKETFDIANNIKTKIVK